VVELVHHDAVESLAAESLEVSSAAQRLDRGEEDAGLAVVAPTDAGPSLLGCHDELL
jgi:hypothetical protein